MFPGDMVFGIGFILLQLFFVYMCFNGMSYRIIGNIFRQIYVFLSIQALCIFLFLAGGYAETRGEFYSFVRNAVYKNNFLQPETLEIKGDPGLGQWVLAKRPHLPRPNFADVMAVREWQTSLRKNLIETFQLPDVTVTTNVKVDRISSKTISGNIVRFFLVFESFDETTIPAYLFIPSGLDPKPAIIVLHGHIWPEDQQGITQTSGIVDSYHNGVALELAKAGFITLALEFRGFGYLGPQVKTDHRLVAYNAILGGSFYKAILSKDIKYAVDLLQSFDEVDPQRIAVTGVSYGGEMAVTYAALDERIKAVVFQGYGGMTGAQKGLDNSKQDMPHYYHMIPGHNNHLFQEDIFYLIAPRPMLGVRGDQDYVKNEEFSEMVGKVYKIFNARQLFSFEIVPGGHEYFVQPAINFFKAHL
jgi:dienelactone hydrolase